MFAGQEATGVPLRRPRRATAAHPLAPAYDGDTTWSDTPDRSCDRVTYSLWCCVRATGAPTAGAPVASRHVTQSHEGMSLSRTRLREMSPSRMNNQPLGQLRTLKPGTMLPQSHEGIAVTSLSSSYPPKCAAVQPQTERDTGFIRSAGEPIWVSRKVGASAEDHRRGGGNGPNMAENRRGSTGMRPFPQVPSLRQNLKHQLCGRPPMMWRGVRQTSDLSASDVTRMCTPISWRGLLGALRAKLGAGPDADGAAIVALARAWAAARQGCAERGRGAVIWWELRRTLRDIAGRPTAGSRWRRRAGRVRINGG